MSYVRTLTCYLCAVEFGMDDVLYQRRLQDHRDFYCPNGHAQRFTGKRDWEKRIEELEKKLDAARRFEDNAWAERTRVLNEFATCPFDNCPAHTYHYANRHTLLKHLADKHHIRLRAKDQLALPPGKAV